MKKNLSYALLLTTAISVMSCKPLEQDVTPANCTNDPAASPLYTTGVNQAITENQAAYDNGFANGQADFTKDKGIAAGKAKINSETYSAAYNTAHKTAYDANYPIGLADPTALATGQADGKKNGAFDGANYGYAQGKANADAQAKADGDRAAFPVASAAGTSKGNYDGASDGSSQGKSQGSADGYNDGNDDGYKAGYSVGYDLGDYDGQTDGYAACSGTNNSAGARKTTNTRLLSECQGLGYRTTLDITNQTNRGYALGSADKSAYQAGYDIGYADQPTIDAAKGKGIADGTAQGKKDGFNAGYSVTYHQGYDPAYTAAYTPAYNKNVGSGYSENYASLYTSYYNAYYTTYYNSYYSSAYNSALNTNFKIAYNSYYSYYYTPGYNDGYATGKYDGYNDGYDDGYYYAQNSSYCNGGNSVGSKPGARLSAYSLKNSHGFVPPVPLAKPVAFKELNAYLAANPNKAVSVSKIQMLTVSPDKDGNVSYSKETLVGFAGLKYTNPSFDKSTVDTAKASAASSMKVLSDARKSRTNLSDADVTAMTNQILVLRRSLAQDQKAILLGNTIENSAQKDRADPTYGPGKTSKSAIGLDQISIAPYKFSWEK